jgi:hypothetical protein
VHLCFQSISILIMKEVIRFFQTVETDNLRKRANLREFYGTKRITLQYKKEKWSCYKKCTRYFLTFLNIVAADLKAFFESPLHHLQKAVTKSSLERILMTSSKSTICWVRVRLTSYILRLGKRKKLEGARSG